VTYSPSRRVTIQKPCRDEALSLLLKPVSIKQATREVSITYVVVHEGVAASEPAPTQVPTECTQPARQPAWSEETLQLDIEYEHTHLPSPLLWWFSAGCGEMVASKSEDTRLLSYIELD